MSGVVVGSSNRVSPVSALPEVVRVTFRQLMGRRRTIWLLILAALPIILAVLFRAANRTEIQSYTRVVYDSLTITILMPLVAILFSTGAFGAEIDDGTIVYLLAKPVPRWMIVVAKAISAIAVSVVLVGASTAIAGVIELGPLGDEGWHALGAMLVGVTVGTVCYSVLFLAVSLFTRRALVLGVGYMLVWEGALSSLLAGISNLSIKQYALGSGNAIYTLPVRESRLSSETAFILAGALVVIALALAIWKLMRFELPGGE